MWSHYIKELKTKTLNSNSECTDKIHINTSRSFIGNNNEKSTNFNLLNYNINHDHSYSNYKNSTMQSINHDHSYSNYNKLYKYKKIK